MTASPAGDRRGLGVALVGLSALVWASGGLFVRLLPYDLWTIVFWRGCFGGLFVGLYVVWRYRGRTLARIRAIGGTGLVVVVCTTATITLFAAAFQHTSVARAMTIYAGAPFFTAAVAWAWLRERPSAATLVASLMVVIGILVMVGPGSGGPRLGDGLAILATSATAVMTVAVRRRGREVEMLPAALLAMLLSIAVALPFAQHLADLTPRDYLVAAGFGLGPMTLGMMLYIVGSAMIPSALAALIGTIEAPVGALWAWVGVGEVPAPTTFAGGGIVLAAVVVRLLVGQSRRITAPRPAAAAPRRPAS
ncbi:MAG: DMT family transporter [Dongiaceae bacterium]